jgi:hypothetical protein
MDDMDTKQDTRGQKLRNALALAEKGKGEWVKVDEPLIDYLEALMLMPSSFWFHPPITLTWIQKLRSSHFEAGLSPS